MPPAFPMIPHGKSCVVGAAMRDAKHTCPRPEGSKRNLHSKTRWFVGFCNSPQVLHFATFFIDARVKVSFAESCYE